MFEVTIRITGKQVAATLCTAWEGGSNYWARADGQPYKTNNSGEIILDMDAFPLTVLDVEEQDGPWTLTIDSIRSGLNAMARKAPKQFAAEFGEDYQGDANSADSFLQFCLFGELVYG